jgi:uncharacterized protein YdhG (YjbR/CyaY superfamily)
MPKIHFSSVDDYIIAQPDAARTILQQVRNAIQKALPKAEEVISYNMPAYKLHGEMIIYFAGWKRHFSLYPADDALVHAFRDELMPYSIDKGTIRFPYSEPPSIKLVEHIARFRALERKAAIDEPLQKKRSKSSHRA